MMHITRIALLLVFSLLLLAGCVAQKSAQKRNKQSSKRYHRSCGCYIYQPNQQDIALKTFVNGK